MGNAGEGFIASMKVLDGGRISIAALAIGMAQGAYDFIKDYPVEKVYRDIKLRTIGEGTSEIQTLVIARQFLSPHDQLTVACV